MDGIHDIEFRKVNEAVGLLKEQFGKWTKTHSLPVNTRGLVIKALHDEQVAGKQKQGENQASFESTKEVLKQLREICKKYHMKEFTEENYPQTEIGMLNGFLQSNANPYLNYKKQATVDRTLVKNNFKHPSKGNPEKAREELIKQS